MCPPTLRRITGTAGHMLYPGDSIKIHCWFDATTPGTTEYFGLGSDGIIVVWIIIDDGRCAALAILLEEEVGKTNVGVV